MQRAQQANRRGEEPRGASKPDSVVTDPRGARGGFNVAVETTRPERQGESARKGKANAASRTCEAVTGSSTSVPRAPCGGRARRSRAGPASDPDPRSPADRDTHRHASVRSRLRARRPRGAGAAPGPRSPGAGRLQDSAAGGTRRAPPRPGGRQGCVRTRRQSQTQGPPGRGAGRGEAPHIRTASSGPRTDTSPGTRTLPGHSGGNPSGPGHQGRISRLDTESLTREEKLKNGDSPKRTPWLCRRLCRGGADERRGEGVCEPHSDTSQRPKHGERGPSAASPHTESGQKTGPPGGAGRTQHASLEAAQARPPLHARLRLQRRRAAPPAEPALHGARTRLSAHRQHGPGDTEGPGV